MSYSDSHEMLSTYLDTCVVQYEISMLPKPTDDSLQIALGWGQATSEIVVNRALATVSSSQDLDLHVLQVVSWMNKGT